MKGPKMTEISKTVGKFTGKTLAGLKKASQKTSEIAKEAPRKTTETISKIKNDLVEGFQSETNSSDNTKIGVVEGEILDTTSNTHPSH
jgi:hypothetical protein